MRLRLILVSSAVIAATFVGATIAMQTLWPSQPSVSRRPALAEVPPLPPETRKSLIVAPTAIALSAIRDAMEANAPREQAGKRSDPVSRLLKDSELGWTVTRGPLTVAAHNEALAVSTVLNGTLRLTGQLSSTAAGGLGALSSVLGKDLGRGVEKLAGRTLDQRADIRGNVAMTVRPALTPAWRMEPNLSVSVSVGDANLSVAGIRVSVASEMKPLLERAVNEQVGALQARLRNDPFLEVAARREWAKLCRSHQLEAPKGAAPKSVAPKGGGPNLWLEVRPVRAFAAQPRIDASAVTITIGVEAETRIVPAETKPECPFPAKLEIVPPAPADAERVNVAVPIDIPFAEVNRLIGAQLAGKTFPEDKSGALEVTVRSATVAASGQHLLMSLRVKASERRSWFGFGTDATVHIWGRPVLDREQQVLRLDEVEVDLESEGLLGAAARAAIPYLQSAVAERAVVDLKPFLAEARKTVEAAVADFRDSGDGVQVDAQVNDLRLVAIAFDALTLRLIAEANGRARVTVSALPKR